MITYGRNNSVYTKEHEGISKDSLIRLEYLNKQLGWLKER